MANAYRDVFLLRTLDHHDQSEGPADKFILFFEGTNSSGTNDIDLSDYFEDDAEVYYTQLMQGSISSGTMTSTKPATEPGDTDDVMTMIVCNPRDIKIDS